MTTPKSVPYRVTYSTRVRERIVAMADEARERGDGFAFVVALREFDRRLALYPQFGEQLYDMKLELGQFWIGFVRPIAMRYGVYDERREVVAGALPVLMPRDRDPAGE